MYTPLLHSIGVIIFDPMIGRTEKLRNLFYSTKYEVLRSQLQRDSATKSRVRCR